MYKVELRGNVIKSLEKLEKAIHTRLLAALLELETNPRPRGVEKVRGTELWRIREGDYRLVYYIDDVGKLVTIVRIGHRRDVYREL